MSIYICRICNKEFTGRKKKYCSQECADEARRIRNRERWREQNPDWNKEVSKTCEYCGENFTVATRYKHAKYCSDECRQMSKNKYGTANDYLEAMKPTWDKQNKQSQKRKEEEKQKKIRDVKCNVCGTRFETSQPNQKTCSQECSRRWKNRRKDKRINKNNIVDRDITLATLYKRDKGICYICGEQTDIKDIEKHQTYSIAGDKYPSIDHVIPLSKGGLHSWNNIRLACRKCNSIKSNNVTDDVLEMLPDKDRAYVYAKETKSRSKEVGQYTLDGKLITTYKSTVRAGEKTGFKPKGIQNCARGETHTYKGFVWDYV